jgi:hypothetical protein
LDPGPSSILETSQALGLVLIQIALKPQVLGLVLIPIALKPQLAIWFAIP